MRFDPDQLCRTSSRPRLSPFDFDVQAETFPALVLKLLPPPPALFATQPFATSSSFPIEPPSIGQVEVVRHALRAHIEQWRNEQLAVSNSSHSGGSNRKKHVNDPHLVNRTAQQHEEMSSRHLDLAYQNWMVQPPEIKRDTWQLELTRAFVRESEKRKDLERQLTRVQQEANQLRDQVEKLGSCQWPREFALFPPDTLPLPRDAARELDSMDNSPNDLESSRWDYDHLVAKWKRVVMHDKSMGRVGVNSYRGDTDEPAPESTIRPKLNPPASENHGEFPSFGYVAHSSGSKPSKHISPYDLAQQSTLNPHQAKRQRLMNGSGKEGNTVPENDHYRSSPQLANGNTTGWSPGSVQSLLTSSNPPTSSVPAHTSRFGGP